MQLSNDQKIRVIENYINIKNHIKTHKEILNILENHLQITKNLINFEIKCYKENYNHLVLNLENSLLK